MRKRLLHVWLHRYIFNIILCLPVTNGAEGKYLPRKVAASPKRSLKNDCPWESQPSPSMKTVKIQMEDCELLDTLNV